MSEFKLFELSVKEDGTMKVELNEDLLQIATEEEWEEQLKDIGKYLQPVAQKALDFVRKKINNLEVEK
jgi:hypothetical protein